MSPFLPDSALPIFGETVSADGQWGGVPWMHGVAHPVRLQGLRGSQVVTFGSAPGRAVLAVTDSDNDLDGPGGSKRVDPCWEAGTSLRSPAGAACDSRTFPGVVVSPALEAFGVRLGDFCLVSWNGAVRSAQVYDIGPTRKAGENSLCLNRGLGLVPAGWSDRRAALEGHDAEDVCTLIFAGSGPGHALPENEIVAGAHRAWAAFTGRASALAKPGSRAASGRVGLAALLVLAAWPAPAALAVFAAESQRLGDPKNYASLGWLLVCAGALLVLFNQGHVAWRNLRPRPERGGNVGRAELTEKVGELEDKIAAAKADLAHQITEARTYAHGKVHDLQNEFSGFRGLHEARSEGVQNRINALMELVHHMRGQFDLVLAEQRASTAATQRAAVATEQAVRLLTEDHSHSAAV